MPSHDELIYQRMAKCAELRLPIRFCGDAPIAKWDLLQMLNRQIAEAMRLKHEQEG